MDAESTSAEIKKAMIELARRRGSGKSICPSEAARRVLPDTWRDTMPIVHRVAGELIQQGVLRATQRGKIVDSRDTRGPYRLIFMAADTPMNTYEKPSHDE